MSRPTRKIGTEALKEAAHQALDGQVSDLDGSTVPIYNGIPRDGNGNPDIEYPHVSIDSASGVDNSSNTTTGEDRTLRISVRSVYNGSKEVGEIASDVAGLLDGNLLDLGDGLTNYHLHYEDDTDLDEPQPDRGRTVRRIVLEFTALIQVTT